MRFVLKIWLMPIVTVFMGLGMLYVFWIGSREISLMMNQIQSDDFVGISCINDLQDKLSNIHGNLRDAVTTGDEDRIANAHAYADSFLTRLDRYAALSGIDRNNLELVRESFGHYETDAVKLAESIIAGVPPEDLVAQAQTMRLQYEALRLLLDTALNQQVESMNAAFLHAKTAQEHLKSTLVTATCIAIVLILLFSSISAKAIITPVRKITHATEALARGDIEQTLDFRSKDEMGRLANAYREMISVIRERADAACNIAAGNLEVDLSIASEKDVLGQAMFVMVERITEKSKAADKISRGDLGVDVPVASEHDVLGQAMRMMVISLRRDREQREAAAEQLRHIAERLQLATRTGRVAIWEFDLRSGELIWDDLMYEFYGLDPQADVINYEEWRKLVHPDDLESVDRDINTTVSGGPPFNRVFRIIRKNDGAVRFVSAIVSLIRDESGAAVGVIGTNWDITDLKQAEEERRKSEEQLSSLIRVAPVGICMISHRNFLVVNDRFCEMLGRTEEELIGASTQIAYYSKAEFERVGRDIYRQIHTDGTGTVECKFRSKDGKVLDVILSGTPIDSHDPLKGITLTVLDITERKKAEKALRESEEHYRNFFENSLVGLFRTRMTDGVFLEVNSVTLNYLGLPLEEVVGKMSAIDLYRHAEQRDEILNILKTQGMVEGYEVDFVMPDGRSIMFSLTARLYPHDNLLEGVVIDITDRKHAEEALRESEERYRRLVSQLGEGVSIVDENETFIFANCAAEQVFGVEEGELVGRNLREFVSSDDFQLMTQKTQERKAGRIDHYELVLQSAKGVARRVVVTASPLVKRTGEFEGVLGITHDITETRELEAKLRQAQKMEAIGTLAGGIAHDFNNILMAMIGYADLIRLNADEGTQLQSDIDAVLKAGRRAKELVKQILVFSRQMDHELRPVMPHLVFKEALKLLRATLPSTINIVQDIHANCGAVLADPTQLHQVLMNLCSNAHYAMRDTGGTLTVGLDCTQVDALTIDNPLQLAEGSYIRLTVSDTGHGMEKNVQERMFDPFFTTKPVGEGTGMGMATTHGIVTSLGGTINVTSEVGVGTTFEIYFPRIEPQIFHSDDSTNDTEKRGRGRALYVDDEEQIAVLGQRMLEHLGYDIVSFTKSTEALKTFLNDPYAFDFVITDQTMPDLTGTELAARILELRPEMPIILVTGYSERVTPESAKQAGIREYIMKPLVLSELGEAISRAVTGT